MPYFVHGGFLPYSLWPSASSMPKPLTAAVPLEEGAVAREAAVVAVQRPRPTRRSPVSFFPKATRMRTKG